VTDPFEQLRRTGIPQHAGEGWIHRLERSVGDRLVNTFNRTFKERPVPGFADAQTLLGKMALGHILRQDQHCGSALHFVAMGIDDHKEDRAVPAHMTPDSREVASLQFPVFQHRPHPRVLFRGTDVEQAHAEHFVPGVSVNPLRGGVDLEKTQGLKIIDPHRRGIALKKPAVAFFAQPVRRLGRLPLADIGECPDDAERPAIGAKQRLSP